MNRRARVITDGDKRRIWASLGAFSAAGNFGAIRTRAIVELCTGTGLRLEEILRLELPQITEPDPKRPGRWQIVGTFYLRAEQAKGRPTTAKRKGYASDRLVVIPKRARELLGAYFREARRRGCIGDEGCPWVVIRQKGSRSRPRALKARGVQAQWRLWQERAGVRDPYRFHDLRHTAITRWASVEGADAFAVAELAGHKDVRTTIGYVHHAPGRLARIVEEASGT